MVLNMVMVLIHDWWFDNIIYNLDGMANVMVAIRLSSIILIVTGINMDANGLMMAINCLWVAVPGFHHVMLLHYVLRVSYDQNCSQMFLSAGGDG